MSELAPSGACGDVVPAEQLPLELRPERPSPVIEEKKGSGSCVVRYVVQQVEDSDKIRWSIEDTDSGDVYLRFEVKRPSQSDRVVYLHKSLPIPASLNLRENLVEKKTPSVNKKNKAYKLDLVKKADFELTPFFKPPSPPSSVMFQ